MAYDKQTWNTGDVITDAKMNHIEDGIAAVEKQQGPVGPAGADGQDGAAGKDAPTITGCTININGTAISGQLTMSEGEPVAITGTYTAGS
ncbi:hypothetical protein [uncultured Megasphaera sp.]|uniref:hypothetical protein n=1 Tax=uncultured Megasphaera sp. TaxID=165188 RepID=UPI00265D1103|nr:hypothetical protein [uncultured Megasphaera sp.]